MRRFGLAARLCQDDGVERAYDVVMVTYGHEETVARALEAVAAMRPAPERVVLVENHPAAGSAARAEAFAGRLPLEIVVPGTDTGFAGGFNLGLGRCGAPWVLSLNPDCAPEPEFTARLLAAAEEEDGAVTGRLVRGEGPALEPRPVLDAAGMIVLPSGRHLDRGAGEPDDGRYGEPARVFGGTGAATLYRRAALDDVAYPDGQVMAESFHAFREDAELAWRLQWRGWSCRYEPSARAVHRRGLRPERGRGANPRADRLSVRNRFLLRWHCADAAWHVACFPWWALRDLAVIGACLTVERRSAGALAELWRLRHDAAARRRWVLGRARVPSRAVRRWFRRGGYVEPVERIR